MCKYIDGNTLCVLNMGMRRQLLKVNTLNKGKPGNVVKVNTYFFNKVPIILIQFDKSDKMGTIGVAESEQITLAFEYVHMAILSGQRGHNPGPLRAIIGGQPKI